MIKTHEIDTELVKRLVSTQFPQWKNLAVKAVTHSGWDNRTFHLGEDMLVRMPSAAAYALQVEKEQHWLPILAPKLPLPIPLPLAFGKPAEGYPWQWSIYSWLEGENAASTTITDLNDFAKTLATFLTALQKIDSTDGPRAGIHNFHRGGLLENYAAETRKAMQTLKDKINVNAAIKVWEEALATTWCGKPVWVHGDINATNLLVHAGKLNAVIDFGQLAVGDPACDLAIAWNFFEDDSRKVFRDTLSLDADTWARGRAWALWKALIIAAGFTHLKNQATTQALQIINEVLSGALI
jgi:aminoglycoside phosphotransferase (APT) family kinase protein